MYKPVYNFMPLEDAEWPIPGEQGWRSGGAVVRALASHQCGPGSILDRHLMWVELVVGSHLTWRVFSGYPGSPPSGKTNISKFQFNQDRGPA